MLSKLQFKPGINRDLTNYSNFGGWFDSNLIRFRNGLPEKIGGWARVYSGQTALAGVCRKMFPWTSLIGTKYIALPTNERFYVDNSTTIVDVSPFRRTLTLGTNPIATTSGSAQITITDTNHGVVLGDIVVLSGAASLAGIASSVLNSTAGYYVTEIVDSNRYKLTIPTTATSTTTGGGSAVVVGYLFHNAATSSVSYTGWSSGAWGGATSPASSNIETNPIATSTTSNATVGGLATTVITVTTTADHNGVVGDWVQIIGAASVGGVPSFYLAKAMQILTVPTTKTFTARVLGTATSSTTGGGTNVEIIVYTASTSTGWGFGPTTTVASYNSGMWTVDNYGEDLVTAPRAAIDSKTLGPGSISTTSGSATVTITQIGHGFATGNSIIIGGAPAVGGIPALDINGSQTITVVDANTFTFVADSTATSTTTGGGAGMYTYVSTLCYWDIANTRATSYSFLPAQYAKKYMPYTATEVLVSDVNRHVIAFGCNPFDTTGAVDKMLIRFSDSNDPTNWDASDTTKTSGELRCSAGSFIVTALQNREEILVFTDVALYTMNYVGAPYTYGLQLVGTGFDIIGPGAKAAAGAVSYWMGLNNFYSYNGSVAPLPCSVRDYVFSDINRAMGDKVYASTDSGNNEVIWFYPSSNATENDRYVVYNYADDIWYYGQMARSAWMDRGQYNTPRAMSPTGYLYTHEVGTDDASNPAAPVPLNAYIQSSPVEIAEGDNYMFVSRIIPDMTFRDTALALGTEPVVKFIVKTQDFPGAVIYPGDTRSVHRGAGATLMVDRFTNQVYTRLRTRSIMLRIESDTLGVAWRLGTPRLELRQDGRK